MATAYAAGIILWHPSVDSNNRTGFMPAATLVELNGLALAASEESVVQLILDLAAGRLMEADYTTWLKAHSDKAKSR